MNVVCYGEIVIDLLVTNDGKILPKVGGAPLNVAVGLKRLGVNSSFVSSVGSDWFGKLASGYLEESGVDHNLAVRKGIGTRLAIISHDDHNERSFEFSHGLAAENFLPEAELRLTFRNHPDIFYFGSFPFANGDSFKPFEKLVRRMRANGTRTIFDPNLRFAIFSSPSDAIDKCLRLAAFSDYVRLNADELLHLTRLPKIHRNKKSLIRKAAAGLAALGPKAIFITDGKDGSYFYSEGNLEYHQSFDVKAVDTTGCGDAFTAAIIAECLAADSINGSAGSMRFANAAGALAATRMGGADSMPDKKSVLAFLKPRLPGSSVHNSIRKQSQGTSKFSNQPKGGLIRF